MLKIYKVITTVTVLFTLFGLALDAPVHETKAFSCTPDEKLKVGVGQNANFTVPYGQYIYIKFGKCNKSSPVDPEPILFRIDEDGDVYNNLKPRLKHVGNLKGGYLTITLKNVTMNDNRNYVFIMREENFESNEVLLTSHVIQLEVHNNLSTSHGPTVVLAGSTVPGKVTAKPRPDIEDETEYDMKNYAKPGPWMIPLLVLGLICFAVFVVKYMRRLLKKIHKQAMHNEDIAVHVPAILFIYRNKSSRNNYEEVEAGQTHRASEKQSQEIQDSILNQGQDPLLSNTEGSETTETELGPNHPGVPGDLDNLDP